HTMFSGDRSPSFCADLKNFVSRLPHALNLARHLRIEEDERVQVAVASMEDVADFELVVIADFADATQHIGKFGTWHNTILHVELGADASNRAKSVFATRPE